VSTDSKRDLSIDRMLKAAFRRQSAPGADGCVDPEALAAWAEGALPEVEAQRVETHLADCARCQSMLAAFAASEPAAAADVMAVAPTASHTASHTAAPVVVPFRPKSPMQTMRWLIPAAAGTIAATLLIWTAWPQPNAALIPADLTMAKKEMTAPAPEPMPAPSTMAESAARQRAPTAASPRGVDPVALPRSTTALADEARQEQKAIASTQQMARQEQVLLGARADATPKPAALPPPPPPTFMPPPSPPPIGAATARSATVTGLPQSALNIAVPTAVLVEFAPPDSTTRGTGGMGRGGGGRGGAAGGGGGRTSTTMAAERATPRVRWRIMTSGQVERSIDAGATWLPVALDPSASVGNGAAPSADVCWLIGRAGLVLLSSDGARFARLPFPEPIDLQSVTAIDARQATVVTVDGRAFTTTDAGQTGK